jgi:DNA polymerase III delta prime subunit
VSTTKKAKRLTKGAAKPESSSDSSSISSTIVPTACDRAELLDIDPNNGRRKRRKTTEEKTDAEGSDTQTATHPKIPQRPPYQRKLTGPKNVPSVQGGINLDLMALVPSGDTEVTGHESHRNEGQGLGDDQSTHGQLKTGGNNPSGSSPMLNGVATAIAANEAPENASIGSTSPENGNATLAQTKPKKVLRLNPKTGTIGSPPAKKPPHSAETAGKKAPGQKKQVKSKVVTIRYGHGQHLSAGIGQKIDQILNNTNPVISLPLKLPAETQKPQKDIQAKPATALHPLFLGKAATKKTSPQKTAPKDNAVIDLTQPKESAVLERPWPQSKGRQSSPTKSASTAFSGFGSSVKIMKFPGAVEPAWPWQGMVHVRGTDVNESSGDSVSTISVLQSRNRKSKYQAIEVLPGENIIGNLATDLSINTVVRDIREIDPDEYPPVPACLRVPTKHYESGLSIQRRVLKELHTRPVSRKPADQSSSEDEIRVTKKAKVSPYPASLSKVYTSIANSFSAFDYGQCESQAWIHKYAPKSADEVLQAGTEAQILKSWLQSLTVKSVEAGLGDRSGSRASSISRRSKSSKADKPAKRKRKSKNVDDFIVSTDEEDDDMDEITEPEDEASPHGKQDLLKKTVIRAGDAAVMGSKEPGKLTNAVLISGPHGCGKTATVYAVAKELGFEVFEINSSSRRNGKDIIEKVGDMTRNHQVQRANDPPVELVDEDKQRIDDALANDLKSGRQGTMNSFFKPKQEAKPKAKAKNTTVTNNPAQTQATVPKPTAKQQKQSLILLEEVDILYKEDTQFWATILSLISTSKRPIIMTCNDESAVPISSLTLHAIIRFAPPSIDLAVDYLLLVAACEGHVLRRYSVETLYEGRHLDLRASLMELNFWCQFAIGDVKRGLDWYYPRWSRREDVDEKGDTIRVVSEETYDAGMGWLSQDFLESDIHHLDVEEEMLHEAYDGWHLDTGDWHKYDMAINAWANKIQILSGGKNDDRAALEMYAEFAEAMSSADLYSGGTFARNNQVSVRCPVVW